MGTFAFKLPDIGEGVVEGEVVEWMVAVGDTVKEDDPILSVMTDKATVEIPSPVNGKVTKVIGEPGDILPVGVVCIEFEVDGEGNVGGTNPSSTTDRTIRKKNQSSSTSGSQTATSSCSTCTAGSIQLRNLRRWQVQQ